MFATGLHGEHIWVYDKTSDSVASRSIRDTAVIGNYYTVPTANGPSDELERALAGLEADAAPGIRRLTSTIPFPIDPLGRAALAGYLGVQYTRVPRHRNEMEEMEAFMAGAMLDIDLSHPKTGRNARASAAWSGRTRNWNASGG
jgi:hypothetical protein